MRIDILTVLPQLLESPFAASIMQRAQDKGHVEIHVHNIRDYSTNKHKNVDDYQYGGGAGMVMSIEPIATLIEKLKDERSYDEVIYMTPDGELFEHSTANQLSLSQNLIILCGHYKGVDERIRNKNISTHSLRKSGSRFIWENNGHSDEYLIKLSSILNHSSTSITRRYLGISREEIKDIYQSFDELI